MQVSCHEYVMSLIHIQQYMHRDMEYVYMHSNNQIAIVVQLANRIFCSLSYVYMRYTAIKVFRCSVHCC